jgi:hypothetical protein
MADEQAAEEQTAEEQTAEAHAAEEHSGEEHATDKAMADAWEYTPSALASEEEAGVPASDDSDAPVSLGESVTAPVEENGHAPYTDYGDVRAENVNISQGGARDVEATTVSITQGGAARVSAEQLTVSQGGVGMARTEQLEVNEGGSAFAVMADKATLEEGSNVFLLVAGQVDGDGRPVIDWRAALAAGVGFAAALSVIRRILR